MRKQTREKRVIWHGRTRDEKLFSSSFETKIPSVVQVHLPTQKIVFCEINQVNQTLKDRLHQDYSDLKGGE